MSFALIFFLILCVLFCFPAIFRDYSRFWLLFFIFFWQYFFSVIIAFCVIFIFFSISKKFWLNNRHGQLFFLIEIISIKIVLCVLYLSRIILYCQQFFILFNKHLYCLISIGCFSSILFVYFIYNLLFFSNTLFIKIFVLFFILKKNILFFINTFSIKIIFAYLQSLGAIKLFFHICWKKLCQPFIMYKKYWYYDVILSYEYTSFYLWTRWGPWTWSIPYLRLYLTYLFIIKFGLLLDYFLITPKRYFINILYNKLKKPPTLGVFLRLLFFFFLFFFFFPNLALSFVFSFLTLPIDVFLWYEDRRLNSMNFDFYKHDFFGLPDLNDWLVDFLDNTYHFIISIFLFTLGLYYYVQERVGFVRFERFLNNIRFFKKYFFLIVIYNAIMFKLDNLELQLWEDFSCLFLHTPLLLFVLSLPLLFVFFSLYIRILPAHKEW